MSLDEFVKLYIDYRNNFLTIEAFAQYHNLSYDTAEQIVNIGRQIAKLKG